MKIVLSGFYGLGNTGDEAILEAIIDNLRLDLDNPDITVLSYSPSETSAEHNVNSIYRGWRRENKEKIQALRKADLLISGGGGLLQDAYPTRFLFGPLPYYLLVVLLAKLCGTKVMFFSQGVGPVTSTWGKILMRLLANRADFITVRDQYSKELLHKLKVNRPKSVVTADIVFGYHKKEDHTCINSLPLKGDERLVAVSVRSRFGYTEHYYKLAEALDELIETDHITPVFVPMEGHHDVEASNEVLNRMKHRDACYLLGGNFTPNQYLNFFSKCEMTIGLRLHSLIFSALEGIPHIGISYDRKVENLLKRTEMWEYSFTLEGIDVDKLKKNARYILSNRKELSAITKKNAMIMRDEALDNIDLLKKHFTK
ncbi:polysaccharide pyruvyl transferase CsaB [Bacillus carboniphilus]|uniref:Polysaccharide pyruvyl transferase CsaB n=1 Tax=Bacillus carboniphilus TaxID=86663 RepID=A0ABP3G700_9BACI